MSEKRLPKIGTCSWKYDSWIGLLYNRQDKSNYLKAYAENFRTVEIDQWFWSLYPNRPIKLPDKHVVEAYASSVPDDFTFTVKAPNCLTLTHYYSRDKTGPLIKNPYFLSDEVLQQFLERLAPMGSKLGPVMFQFEYLNKKKMPEQQRFMDLLDAFFNRAPKGLQYAVEIRNPNYLNPLYFEFIRSRKVGHVFSEGYYMPHIPKVYNKYRNYIWDYTVMRLLGPDRKEIEKRTGNRWHEIVTARDEELDTIAQMIESLILSGVEVIVNVNNHFEGSAPKTARRLLARL